MNIKFFETAVKSALRLNAILPITVIIFIIWLPETNFALALNSTVSVQDKSFATEFREGRDLIDKEEWTKAAVKFNEIIGKYPRHDSTDAALYWLAFCYKKQKQFKEADAALDRLLKGFPDSSWVDDARVMKLEIGNAPGRVYLPSTPMPTTTLPMRVYSADLPKIVEGTTVNTFPTYSKNAQLSDVYTAIAKPQLDREDEIKLAAFQSLLSADPKRAIETMGEVLTPNSKASETLKQEVLRALRSPRFSREQNLNVFRSGVSNQLVPQLRETLVKGFQRETNTKIRKEIVYALASINDEQSFHYLTQLYSSENDLEIKKAIINSFGNPVQHLFHAQKNDNPMQKAAFNRLIEIARTEKNLELRRHAFTNLQKFGNWTANEQAVEMLARLYDAENDEQFKISLIRTLSNIRQNQASKKLLEIAKNDKSDKLKLEAIYSLRNSKDPEVLKFLEELIK